MIFLITTGIFAGSVSEMNMIDDGYLRRERDYWDTKIFLENPEDPPGLFTFNPGNQMRILRKGYLPELLTDNNLIFDQVDYYLYLGSNHYFQEGIKKPPCMYLKYNKIWFLAEADCRLPIYL